MRPKNGLREHLTGSKKNSKIIFITVWWRNLKSCLKKNNLGFASRPLSPKPEIFSCQKDEDVVSFA